MVELVTSPLSRFTLRDLLFSAELALVEDEAVAGCVDDAVDEAVPEETPRSRETSLISRHSIFAAFLFYTPGDVSTYNLTV